MTFQAKFVGHLVARPKREGPKKCGFTTLALVTVAGAAVGEVQAILDPTATDKPETCKDALEWDAGDLVQLEGEVLKIGKCKCCGNPLPVVDAFKCFRVREMM